MNIEDIINKDSLRVYNALSGINTKVMRSTLYNVDKFRVVSSNLSAIASAMNSRMNYMKSFADSMNLHNRLALNSINTAIKQQRILESGIMRQMGAIKSIIPKIPDHYRAFEQLRIHIPDYSRIMQKIDFQLPNLSEKIGFVYKKLVPLLGQYNYLLPMNLYFDDLVVLYKVLKESDKNKEENIIDKFFLEKISENKWKYVKSLISQLEENEKIKKERIVILNDCLKIIRRFGKNTASNVVLPTVIAQIEGIWVDLLGDDKKNKIKELNTDKYNEIYHDTACELLNNVLFEYTRNKEPKCPDFCRNKILHGEFASYGNINSVIKAFLIIEFLNNIEIESKLQAA